MTMNSEWTGEERQQGFQFVPDDVRPSSFERIARRLLDELAQVDSLASSVSDVLDSIGLHPVVDATLLPLRTARRPAVGHAITIRYLPSRAPLGSETASGLATAAALDTAAAGDVLVIDAGTSPVCSTFGGNAAMSAAKAGVSGVIVDGAVRDVDELSSSGLAVWSRAVTPRTGRWRLQAVSVNGAVGCGGVQVRAGDLVCADDTGICFVPTHAIREVLESLVGLPEAEA